MIIKLFITLLLTLSLPAQLVYQNAHCPVFPVTNHHILLSTTNNGPYLGPGVQEFSLRHPVNGYPVILMLGLLGYHTVPGIGYINIPLNMGNIYPHLNGCNLLVAPMYSEVKIAPNPHEVKFYLDVQTTYPLTLQCVVFGPNGDFTLSEGLIFDLL